MSGDYNCKILQTVFYDIVLALISGIASSLLTTVLLKYFDKEKAKKILLNNYRFMESIEESHLFARLFLVSAKPILHYFGGIEWFHFPGKIQHRQKINFLKDKKCQKDILKFLEQNKYEIETILDVITSEKNDVIYETINKSLGISFDQDLCNISDNLKNLSLIYSRLFDIFAYISYLFDLYAFLGIENKLNRDFDISQEIINKS